LQRIATPLKAAVAHRKIPVQTFDHLRRLTGEQAGVPAGDNAMKCDLCKRELPTQYLLCQNCTDAVRRLVRIAQAQRDGEAAPLAGTAQKVAAGTR